MVAAKAIVLPAIFAVLGDALPHANSHPHGHAHAALHLRRQQHGSITATGGAAQVTEPADMRAYSSMMSAYNSSISAYEASMSAYAASVLAANPNANSAAVTSSAAKALSSHMPTPSASLNGPTSSISFGSPANPNGNTPAVHSSSSSGGGGGGRGAASSSTTSSQTSTATKSTSTTGGSSNSSSSSGGSSANFGDSSYQCYGGIQSKYPTKDHWISLEAMVSNYQKIVGNANPSISGACDTLGAAVKSAEQKYGLDARVIFALVLQESGGGQFDIWCTGTDCGMMQTSGGCTYNAKSCTVQDMINQGVGGLQVHSRDNSALVTPAQGLAALVKGWDDSIWEAARVYNSGEHGIDKSNLDKSDSGTLSYVNDMANRLMGWVPSGPTSPWCNACPHVAAGGVCN